MFYSRVLEFYGIHQVMQGDMRIASAQTSEQRGHKAGESHQRVASERTEQEIEPDHVGFQLVQYLKQVDDTAWVVKGPAAQHIKPLGLNVLGRELIGQHRKVEERIALQLLRDMKAIFAQSSGAWGESSDQADFH